MLWIPMVFYCNLCCSTHDVACRPNYNINTWQTELYIFKHYISLVDIASYLPNMFFPLFCTERMLSGLSCSYKWSIMWPMRYKRRPCDWVLAKGIWMQMLHHAYTPRHRTPMYPKESWSFDSNLDIPWLSLDFLW